MKIAEQDHKNELNYIIGSETLRDVPKRGIIHIGAHEGQEVEQYLAFGFTKILLIEANPELCEGLISRFGSNDQIDVLNYAVCDREGVLDLHIHTSRSGSTEPASILPMKRFKDIVKTLHTPRTVPVPATTLDSLFSRHALSLQDYNLINIDVQGAELLALQGAAKTLASIDAVIAEVNLVEMYEGGPLEAEVVDFMNEHGFEKKEVLYHTLYDETSTFPAWGECLFVKRAALR